MAEKCKKAVININVIDMVILKVFVKFFVKVFVKVIVTIMTKIVGLDPQTLTPTLLGAVAFFLHYW